MEENQNQTPPAVAETEMAPAPVETIANTKKELPKWLQFSGVFDAKNPLRRELLFFIAIFILTFSVLWGWAHGWKMYLAELNPNLFHETVGTILAIAVSVWSYFKLYRTSDSFVQKQETKEKAEAAALAAKKKAEQDRKDTAFAKILINFESTKTFEERTRILGDLLTIGVESPSLRQRTVNALMPMNQWMVENKIYLCTQNLISWRLKNNLFEVSTRFRENGETQDASIKTISIIENITRKHLEEFIAGHNTETLDLSGHCLPTLNLSAKEIPPGSLKMNDGNYWQSSFSESHITDMSFADSDFYGTSFWRAKLENTDFTNAILKGGKLRTNLQYCTNILKDEFFATKEWELCLITRAQEKEFFGDPIDEQSAHFRKWISTKIRREKLYFGLERL